MYACGVSLKMNYGSAGIWSCVISSDCSGAGAEYSLRSNFLYDGNLKGMKACSK
jgi:hypothetical protein